MLYKEWRQTRLKFGLMLALYVLAGILVNTIFAPRPEDFFGRSVFDIWVVAAIIVTMLAGVLGGVDAVAEENDRGTLGFLLVHPVSRRRVFTTKIVLNSLALAIALALTSVAAFFTQVIPRYFSANVAVVEYEKYIRVPTAEPFVPVGEAVGDVITIMALGVLLVCLSAAVSVFAHNTIQATYWTLLLVFFGFLGIYGLAHLLSGGNFFLDQSTMIHDFYNISLPIFAVLAALTAGIYLYGLRSFRRKDF